MSHLVATPSPVSKPTKTTKTTKVTKATKAKEEEKKEERAVNPMTMIPAGAAISQKAPLPPKAERLKRLYGF